MQLLKSEAVTILNQTPSYFYQLMQEERADPESNLNIRKIIFGGEALNPSFLKDWKLKYPLTQLINMYGITETTVHVTYKEITERKSTRAEATSDNLFLLCKRIFWTNINAFRSWAYRASSMWQERDLPEDI